MSLTGKQTENLVEALCDAFDHDSLEQMVRFKLGKGPTRSTTLSRTCKKLVRVSRNDSRVRKYDEVHPGLGG